MKHYRIIKRYIYNYDTKTLSNEKYDFIAEGIWANGNLAYTKIEDIKNNNYEEYCMYEQGRYKRHLVMFRV